MFVHAVSNQVISPVQAASVQRPQIRSGNGLCQRIGVLSWSRRAYHGERSSSVARTVQDTHRRAAISFAVPSVCVPHVLRGRCSLLSDEGSARRLEDPQVLNKALHTLAGVEDKDLSA